MSQEIPGPILRAAKSVVEMLVKSRFEDLGRITRGERVRGRDMRSHQQLRAHVDYAAGVGVRPRGDRGQ